MNGVTQWEAKEIIREKNARIEALTAEIERLREALEESLALNINYHAVEEQDGYQFTEAPAVIEAARAALGDTQ